MKNLNFKNQLLISLSSALIGSLIIAWVTLIGIYLTRQEQEYQREYQKEKQQQEEQDREIKNNRESLKYFMNYISGLQEKKILTSNDNYEIRKATARTQTTLRYLNPKYKGLLLEYLNNAELINGEKPIIALHSMDIEKANFKGILLKEVNFQYAKLYFSNFNYSILETADFSHAILVGANLTNAILTKANFQEVVMFRSDLTEAYLKKANFQEADLREVNFQEADLKGANFKQADITEANFQEAKNLTATQIKSACNWHKAIYSKDFIEELIKEPSQQIDCRTRFDYKKIWRSQ